MRSILSTKIESIQISFRICILPIFSEGVLYQSFPQHKQDAFKLFRHEFIKIQIWDTQCLLRWSSAVRQLTIRSSSYSYETVLPSLEHATRLVRINLDLPFCWCCIPRTSTSENYFGHFLKQAFKSVSVCDNTETKNRPFLKIKFANKGIDALNLSNFLKKKSVQSNIPPMLSKQGVIMHFL